ncbi:MAG: AAA family ATPase [Actinomycetota bacterium]|nr:AAA family ATPase [Actinomycetota bacterium]
MIVRQESRPVIEKLRIQNYRVLRDVTFDHLTPLTVLFGPNGSGKSTVFDVFAFLNEAFTTNLRRAWDRRNRMHEIRSRGEDGPVVFEIKYREGHKGTPDGNLVTYRLAIDEQKGLPTVIEETLRWSTAPGSGRSRDILAFANGAGTVYDEPTASNSHEQLDSPDLLAVSTLGQLSRHPRVAALRRFISGWYLSYVSADHARALPDAGPQERLSQSGDNLPNVVQYLQEQHPDRLAEIFRRLGERVPNLERLEPEQLADQRLVAMTDNGSQLGSLWMEGYFGVGDPLVRSGRPA